jgi:hypothetical protein
MRRRELHRNLGAIRLDDSRDESASSARSGFGEERFVGWGWLAAQVSAASRRAYSAAIVRGLRSRPSAFATPTP